MLQLSVYINTYSGSCDGMTLDARNVDSLMMSCEDGGSCAGSEVVCPALSEDACAMECYEGGCDGMTFNTRDVFEHNYLDLECVYDDYSDGHCGDDEVTVNCVWQDSVTMAWNDDKGMFECSATGDDKCCPYEA